VTHGGGPGWESLGRLAERSGAGLGWTRRGPRGRRGGSAQFLINVRFERRCAGSLAPALLVPPPRTLGTSQHKNRADENYCWSGKSSSGLSNFGLKLSFRQRFFLIG